jgi:hypothetical protein
MHWSHRQTASQNHGQFGSSKSSQNWFPRASGRCTENQDAGLLNAYQHQSLWLTEQSTSVFPSPIHILRWIASFREEHTYITFKPFWDRGKARRHGKFFFFFFFRVYRLQWYLCLGSVLRWVTLKRFQVVRIWFGWVVIGKKAFNVSWGPGRGIAMNSNKCGGGVCNKFVRSHKRDTIIHKRRELDTWLDNPRGFEWVDRGLF